MCDCPTENTPESPAEGMNVRCGEDKTLPYPGERCAVEVAGGASETE